MKKLALIIALGLTGCATPVPVTVKFPDVPKELLITCADLDKVPPTEEQLSEMMKVVVKNYGSYHECKLKVDSWIDWYKKQKEISDSITK
jgi:hypothetical protein